MTGQARRIQTREQRDILARYARGDDIAEIAADGYNRDLVSAVVSQLASLSRQRAGVLVRDWDARVAAVAAARGPRPAPAPGQQAPAPAEPTPAAEPADELAGLIERGLRSFDSRARILARRVGRDLDELRARLAEVADEQARLDAEAEARAEAERRVAQARAQLEAALAEAARLKQGTPAPPPRARAPRGRGPQIRAWAQAQGIDCPANGRLTRRVLDAWRAAHPEEEES
jgi:hypothetical protein